jgi:hypothetical protein
MSHQDQVELLQPQPPAKPIPAATPEPELTTQAAPSVKKVAIICVKGKLQKKVSAVKPTCPKGYKKVTR